ncbi:MAG: hypothetical protein JSR33_05700, partial [Proteobacteria bacterium]|nr:hypothetical protein [Pseudomonadota bacterium]
LSSGFAGAQYRNQEAAPAEAGAAVDDCNLFTQYSACVSLYGKPDRRIQVKSEIKNNSMVRHFIFTVEQKPTGSQILVRTGVQWQSLLGTLISVPCLKQAFWAELKKVCVLYPQLADTRARKISGQSSTVPQYNYIAPEGKWIEQINLDSNWLVNRFIPHLKNLFAGMILPTWIALQIINPLLAAIARIHPREEANYVGRLFLKAAIDSFREKHGKFFAFLFNLLQELFQRENYSISVSKTLVHYKLPVRFLRDVYFLHPKNEAAQYDIWQWFIEDQDFFGAKFNKFWLEHKYSNVDIQNFKDGIMTIFPPESEYEQYADPAVSDLVPVYPMIYSPYSLTSSAASLSSLSSPMIPLMVPMQPLSEPLTSPYIIPQYPLMIKLYPVALPPIAPNEAKIVRTARLQELPSNEISPQILASMRTQSVSSNPQVFLNSHSSRQQKSDQVKSELTFQG